MGPMATKNMAEKINLAMIIFSFEMVVTFTLGHCYDIYLQIQWFILV